MTHDGSSDETLRPVLAVHIIQAKHIFLREQRENHPPKSLHRSTNSNVLSTYALAIGMNIQAITHFKLRSAVLPSFTTRFWSGHMYHATGKMSGLGAAQMTMIF